MASLVLNSIRSALERSVCHSAFLFLNLILPIFTFPLHLLLIVFLLFTFPLHLLLIVFILFILIVFLLFLSNLIPSLFLLLAPLCDINMMASLVLNSIRSSLNALERSEDYIQGYIGFIEMKCKLKNLELFVLCARKLGNDDAQRRFFDGKVCTLASLFQRIHLALPRNPDNLKNIYNLGSAIDNFSKEIGGWYTTFLDSLPQPTFDKVTHIVDSVLEHLNYLIRHPYSGISKQPIEALIEKVTFLRNFIRFATLRSIESPQLLAHIQAVAVDAAHTSFMFIFQDCDEEKEYYVKLDMPVLLQMIKMVDPQVDETYTQALTRAKLSTHLLSPIIMKDFIDFLLWNLWERLHLDIPIVISTDSELRLVYEFLRLLSNVLKEKPNKFEKRIGELTRVVICDAGILIFSLYQRDMEIDVPDSGLLERINRITQIVKGKDFSIPDLLQRISHVTQIVKGKDFSIPDLLQRISRIEQGSSDINMMASVVLISIRSALNALESSDDYIEGNMGCMRMKYKLKNLELFVLCATKLGNDDAQLRFYDGQVCTLASLFQRIHDALPRNPPPYNSEILKNFEGTIANFKKEIGGWYNTLSVSLPQPTFDEVTDFIDSLLEHLNGFFYSSRPIQPIQALIEKIRFLRNFIRFATLRSIESPQLLAHIQAVAVDAAHTSFMCIFLKYDEEGEYDVELNIPVLLQMIKMVNHQVDETYTQALTSAKLSTRLLSPIIMKDFIDSLLLNLWERLHLDTPIVISTNSELRLVYEGLRLLRSMLKAQPNKFDEGIGEHTRVVICDAGILIFSLYQRDMEKIVPASGLLQRINRITQIVKGKDFSIPDLLQRISRVRQRVEGKDLSIPDLLQRIHRTREQVGGNDLPRTNALGFIDFVLENLLGMTSSKPCYGFQSQFRMIHDELSSLRCSLGKIEGLRNEQKELEALWNDGVKVVYRVEFLIDDLVFGDFQGSSSTSFYSTVEDILREVKSINSKIHPASDNKVKKVSMTPNPVPSQNRAPVADDIVGFDDEVTSIIDRITRGSKQLKVVAIVGMPGMGKTTLATKVFKHPSVTYHFHVLLQCCVSQLFHKKKLLLELLNLVDPHTNNEMSEQKLDDANTNIKKSEQELTEKLWRHLKGKRYLIFLDDVWDIEAWDSLKTSFPDDDNGSRILVTSRQRAAVLPDEEPHFLHLLTDDQSWELIRKKLPLRNELSLELDELGKQIAANCKGLPLTVVIVAGLLANTEPEGWKIFLESIRLVSGANHCMNTLELSYKHLPGHLKQCFLYFGLFPEDHEVPVRRLIRLWIAEGFVLRSKSKSIEDVARDYMMDLVGRSLVMMVERSRGRVKACRIHDLLHDFCRTKVKEENFVQVLGGGYEEFISFKEPGYMRRLCVHSEKKHFKNLRVFCPRLHSLLFFGHDKGRREGSDMSFIIPRYRRLRVLDIRQYSSSNFGIPSEIGLVLQLKYLSVSVSVPVTRDTDNIPWSIGSLANLETFILDIDGFSWVSMPDTFWNLQKLRHVDIKRGFCLAFEGLEKFPELCELQSCYTVVIPHGESIERLVRKFPNIRKLHCHFELKDSNEIEILIPDSLRQLESLVLRSQLITSRLGLLDDLPGNLKKLSLKGSFLLHDVSNIGKLPNLEVLKFEFVNFPENKWDMVEGEFSTLRFLELDASQIVRWTASDDSDDLFPCLEELVLRYCYFLEEIPCRFESINTLEMVEVYKCSDTVKNFFKRIQDEQTELGNSLKFQISK